MQRDGCLGALTRRIPYANPLIDALRASLRHHIPTGHSGENLKPVRCIPPSQRYCRLSYVRIADSRLPRALRGGNLGNG